jgi:hypothetical protein
MPSNPIEVFVFELPLVDVGADIVICGGDNHTFDAGNGGTVYLWSNGATTQTIAVDSTGLGYGVHTFWVSVTNENNCVSTDTVKIEFLDCTVINEQTQALLSVYPNPGNGLFDLEINNTGNRQLKIRVYNQTGNEVLAQSIQATGNQIRHKLDLTNQPKGVYTLIIESNRRITRKLIIQ